MSARPFLAPCVELKYSNTDKPSLKFEIIGVSIISPEGLAIEWIFRLRRLFRTHVHQASKFRFQEVFAGVATIVNFFFPTYYNFLIEKGLFF